MVQRFVHLPSDFQPNVSHTVTNVVLVQCSFRVQVLGPCEHSMAATAANAEAHAAVLEQVPGPLLETSVLKDGVRQLLFAGTLHFHNERQCQGLCLQANVTDC